MAWDRRKETPQKVWQWFKKAKTWKERINVALLAINTIPNWTYPAGLDAYWDCLEQDGQENWKSPANIWRQIWHFMGGFVLGLLFPTWPIFIGITLKETNEVIRNKRIYFKNIADIAVWTAGAFWANLI